MTKFYIIESWLWWLQNQSEPSYIYISSSDSLDFLELEQSHRNVNSEEMEPMHLQKNKDCKAFAEQRSSNKYASKVQNAYQIVTVRLKKFYQLRNTL